MESRLNLIEKYLTNDMSVGEQVEFEDLLRTDPDLMREYILRNEIDNAVIEDDILNLRDSLNCIVNEKSSFPIKFKKPTLYTSIAAVVVVLIIIIGIKFLPVKNQRNTEIFQSYYSPYSAIMSFRSSVDQSEVEETLYKAFSLYDNEKYELASSHFNKVLNLDSTNYLSQFYLSICEIEKNHLQDAKEHLNDLILKKNHVFWEQSNWYLALVCIKQNELNEAENLFNKIVQENMARKADAKEILKKLN